jgi:hypothetical protein
MKADESADICKDYAVPRQPRKRDFMQPWADQLIADESAFSCKDDVEPMKPSKRGMAQPWAEYYKDDSNAKPECDRRQSTSKRDMPRNLSLTRRVVEDDALQAIDTTTTPIHPSPFIDTQRNIITPHPNTDNASGFGKSHTHEHNLITIPMHNNITPQHDTNTHHLSKPVCRESAPPRTILIIPQ